MFQMFNRLTRDKRGFTLVELIVVIAVLGILAGIAIPRLTGVQDKAKKEALMTAGSSVQRAMETVRAETGSYSDGLSTDSGSLSELAAEINSISDGDINVSLSGENITVSVNTSNSSDYEFVLNYDDFTVTLTEDNIKKGWESTDGSNT